MRDTLCIEPEAACEPSLWRPRELHVRVCERVPREAPRDLWTVVLPMDLLEEVCGPEAADHLLRRLNRMFTPREVHHVNNQWYFHTMMGHRADHLTGRLLRPDVHGNPPSSWAKAGWRVIDVAPGLDLSTSAQIHLGIYVSPARRR